MRSARLRPDAPRWTRRGRLLLALVLTAGVTACCLSIGMGGCCGQQSLASVTELGIVHFACPGDPVVVDVVDARTLEVLRTETGLRPSEPITDIPEFHDCQRLVVDGRYDSLYAIFASFRLDSLSERWLDTLPLRKRGSGTRMPRHAPGLTALPRVAVIRGQRYVITTRPAATIYSHGGRYAPLGIEPGFNCLFLVKEGAGWTARMVPTGGSTDPNCGDQLLDAAAVGKPLDVKIASFPSFADGDFPAVARWEWDATHREQYVGIACGRSWCEVGRPGFVPSQAVGGSPNWGAVGRSVTKEPPGSRPHQRVFKVRGWFDAQPLENVVGTAMHPGPDGVLIPNPSIDAVNHIAPLSRALREYEGVWSHVATARVKGSYAKWNYVDGDNEIHFCYGTTLTCHISEALPRAPGSATQLTSCPQDPTNKDLKWWAMIVSAGQDTAYACVERMDHSQSLADYIERHPNQKEIRIPGAARWRYIPTDAANWISCPSGCCTIW